MKQAKLYPQILLVCVDQRETVQLLLQSYCMMLYKHTEMDKNMYAYIFKNVSVKNMSAVYNI